MTESFFFFIFFLSDFLFLVMEEDQGQSRFTLDGGLKDEYERSKFLGGDEEHTHLVKGLDYALLAREREAIEKKEQMRAKEAQESLKEDESSAVSQSSVREKNAMAQRVIGIVCEGAGMKGAGSAMMENSNAFVKGRVVFKYDFERSSLPSTMILGRNVVQDAGEREERLAVQGLILKKVAAVYERIKKEEEERKRKKEKALQSQEPGESVTTSAAAAVSVSISDEDAIFPGAKMIVKEESSPKIVEGGGKSKPFDYFSSETTVRTVSSTACVEEKNLGKTLLEDLEEEDDKKEKEDEEVRKIKAELERIRELQQAADAEDAAEKEHNMVHKDGEMDPAMRRYFSVCHSHTFLSLLPEHYCHFLFIFVCFLEEYCNGTIAS